MKEKTKNQEKKDDVFVTQTSSSFTRIVHPLIMTWQPEEDISTFELALCLPYLLRNRSIMPYEVDDTLSHFRHFLIVNPNE